MRPTFIIDLMPHASGDPHTSLYNTPVITEAVFLSGIAPLTKCELIGTRSQKNVTSFVPYGHMCTPVIAMHIHVGGMSVCFTQLASLWRPSWLMIATSSWA